MSCMFTCKICSFYLLCFIFITFFIISFFFSFFSPIHWQRKIFLRIWIPFSIFISKIYNYLFIHLYVCICWVLCHMQNKLHPIKLKAVGFSVWMYLVVPFHRSHATHPIYKLAPFTELVFHDNNKWDGASFYIMGESPFDFLSHPNSPLYFHSFALISCFSLVLSISIYL